MNDVSRLQSVTFILYIVVQYTVLYNTLGRQQESRITLVVDTLNFESAR